MTNSQFNGQNFESSLSPKALLMVLIASALGMLAAMLVLPSWLPGLTGSLTGQAPKAYWYLSRATAFVSFGMLWASMMLGVGISNKMSRLWPGAPAAFALHEYFSLLGLAFAAFHALILLGDHYANFSLVQVIMPFATDNYRPLWVGLGQIGFYTWAILVLSFYIRKEIGQNTWRALHYLSFFTYLGALTHGLVSGTDSTLFWVQGFYWLTSASFLFLLIARIVNSLALRIEKRLAKPSHG